MATDNKSISYLQEREKTHRFLTGTADGRLAIDNLRQDATPEEMQRVLGDDRFTDHATLREEHRGGVLVAESCREAREAFTIDQMHQTGAKWVRFFAPPFWYYIRRQIDSGNPEYWKDPANTMREALECPQWATVPAWYIRGELMKFTHGTVITPAPVFTPASEFTEIGPSMPVSESHDQREAPVIIPATITE